MTQEFHTDEIASKLRSSFLEFTQFFYPILTGRKFIMSQPTGRESHHVTIGKALTQAFRLEIPNHRLIINVSPGSGKPLWEKTLLLKDNGQRISLSDIKIGDKVLTHAGRFRKVNKIYIQGELETLKITTFSGRIIYAAYDHPFLTAKGYKNAIDLQENDVLGCAVPSEDFGQKIKDEEARLLGYFIGDGSVSGNNANITGCDLKTLDDIEHCVKEMGFIATKQQYKRKNVLEHHSKNTTRINIKNGVRDWLALHDLKNKTSYTKRVPKCILLGDKKAICNFLGAYFCCDGTFGLKQKSRRDFSARVTSVSLGMLEDCQHLFMRLGIRTRLRKKVRNQITKKQGNQYISYDLELSSQDDMYNFTKLIVPYIFHEKAKQLKIENIIRVRFDQEILPDAIVSIEKSGLLPCRCIEVQDDHTFTANDIIVHNSTMLSMWIAWTMASFPDARFLYISYSKVLAAKHTETIKRIMQLSNYEHLFKVKIRHDSKAREYFQTTAGGAVAAFGSGGAITGQDAGLPGLSRFSGAVIIDDAHKPDEVHSDTIRQSVIDNYRETIQQRARGINVPFIFIGQRLHEDDLGAYLISGKDGYDWHQVILKSIDEAGNALYPEVDTLAKLLKRQETDPYVFASQYQQNPIPAGGSLFKPEWFILLDEEPEIISTFIVCDTAETSKNWNDATVFSFFGIYQIEEFGRKTNEFALHWLDCIELRIEPKDLEINFLNFVQDCMRHPIKPTSAWIEKKSTGSTLISVLKDKMRTVQIREIERNRSSGSKTERFLRTQPYIAGKKVSFTRGCKHQVLCIDHMSKITANEVHRFDDIADTLSDAVKIGLIDKMLVSNQINQQQYADIAKSITSNQNKINRLRKNAYTR